MKAFEKPLSAKEEKEMIERFHNGDNKARDILVEKNMRLVAHMTKKYSTPDRDVRDLISVGTVCRSRRKRYCRGGGGMSQE